MTLLLATQLLQVIAAALAIALALRCTDHRPVAALLTYGAVANSLRVSLQEHVVIPAVIALGGEPALGITPAGPLTGWARAAAHADHALLLGWSAGVAICALWVFWPDRKRTWSTISADGEPATYVINPWPMSRWVMLGPALVWAALVAYFVATYPDSRSLHRTGYLLADLLAIGAGAAAFVGWLRRRDAAEGLPVPKLCVLLIVGLDAVALLGPHLAPGFYAGWDRALGAYVVLYGLLVLIQGGSLCDRK